MFGLAIALGPGAIASAFKNPNTTQEEDWSDPKHIVLTTTDSNLWGGRSGHTYTLTTQPNGTTEVDVVIVRDGKNFKGRMLGAFLGIIGKGQLEKWFANTLRAIEARNYRIGLAANA